jgi:hypothetical protein
VNGPIISHVRQAENCQVQNFYKGTKFFVEKLSPGNRLKRAEIESKPNLEMVGFRLCPRPHFGKSVINQGSEPFPVLFRNVTMKLVLYKKLKSGRPRVQPFARRKIPNIDHMHNIGQLRGGFSPRRGNISREEKKDVH